MSNTTTPDALLGLIRSAETSKGYEDYYSGSAISPPKPLTQMTLREVRAWQDQSVAAGSESSAVGGYQIIRDTFDGVTKQLGFTGDELFTPEIQDQMGMHLMAEDGYNDWVAGNITDEQFGNNLAKTWAGLPVMNGTDAGRSYYAGDGLNASTVQPGNVIEALNASRNGTSYDFVRGTGGGTTGGTSGGPSQFDLALSDLKPMENFSEQAQENVTNTPIASFRSQAVDRAIAEEAAASTPSWWDGAKMAANEEWIELNVARQLGREEFTPDSSFRLTEDLWKEVTDGLDPIYQEGLDKATSEAHLRALAKQFQSEQQIDQDLAGLGWGGTGLRLGAAILDPVALLASAATKGVAAPFIYGAKVGRMGRALRAGTAAGAVNAGIDGYLASQDQTMGWEDIAISAATGFVLGGTIGGLRGKTPEDKAIAAALQRDFVDGSPVSRFMGGTADGSMGAARVPKEVQLSAAEQVAADSAGAPTAAMAGARIDRSSILKSSESDIMRRLGGGLVEDGVGNADRSANRFSVSEKVAREERVRLGRFYRQYNASYRDWLKDEGKGLFWQHGVNERSQFNRMVSQAVRRDIEAVSNKHVGAVAGQMKKEFADLLEFGKQQGIRGFDQVKANHNYMVRRHRIDRLDDLVGEFGESSVKRLVAESIRSASRKWRNANPGKSRGVDEIEYGDSFKIAEAYIKSIRSRRFGQFDVNRALAGQDMDTLKMMLDDAGMASEDITRITDKIRFDGDNGDRGRIASAKWRLDLDETHRSTLYSKNGTKREVGIEDFLEDDAEMLMGQYVRSVTATGHMEDFLKDFRVRDAEGNLPVHAPSFETVKGYIAKEASEKGMSTAKFNKEMKVLDNSHKLVHGIPIEGASNFRTAQRMLRDYNFSRIGGQLGVAQLAEVGNIIGNGGLRVLVQNMPALKKIFANAKTGKLSDDFLNEAETIWGFGTDLERMNMSAMFDESGAVEAASGMQRADHVLQRAKRVTVVGSGMGHVNMVLQRMNSRVIVQRFMDDATGRRGINVNRMRGMGITDEMQPRIQAQLRKHVDQSEGMLGKKVQRINIDKWDDLDAKNAFVNGVDRWAKKSVQENDIGNMPDFMSYELGKTIGQFRSFMMASYVKQTLAGLHNRDWETFSAFATSMFFGGLFYAAQQQVNSIGRDDREEFLSRRLDTQSIAKAAFQRAAFSSVLPLGFDTAREAVGLEPIFDFRSSGLRGGGGPVGALMGNPSADLIDGAFRATGGIAASMRGDYQFSEEDAQAAAKVFMMQNMFGVRNVISAVTGTLPEYSQ